MPGPYNTYEDVNQEPLVQEIRQLHYENRVPSGDPDGLVRGATLAHLVQACSRSGVKLGQLDHRILLWLAGYAEAHTVQVIIGLIVRAHLAGRATVPVPCDATAEARAIVDAEDAFQAVHGDSRPQDEVFREAMAHHVARVLVHRGWLPPVEPMTDPLPPPAAL